MIINLPKLYNGDIVNHKKVETYKVSSIEINELGDQSSYIEADGELIGTSSLKASIIPNAIQIFKKS